MTHHYFTEHAAADRRRRLRRYARQTPLHRGFHSALRDLLD